MKTEYKEMSAYESAMKMEELKDHQNISDLGGWCTEEPTIDCLCLVDTKDVPKNCHYVVAEWNNDTKHFYSETAYTLISYDRYKIIEPINRKDNC